MITTTQKINVKYINTLPVVCTIEYDDYNDNPLTWTTPSERGCWYILSHKNYELPNELDINFDDYSSWKELVDKNIKNNQVYKFVNWYEHGNISISLTDNPNSRDFDSGIVGVIIADSMEELNASFLDYKAHIQGDLYRYLLTDANGNTIDACGGYLDIQAIYDELSEYENIQFKGINE